LTLILIYFLFNIFFALHTKITTDTWVKVTLFQNSEYNIMFLFKLDNYITIF